VRRDVDVNFISAATVECLLRFVGLQPGEITAAFDAKFNE